MEEFRWHSYAMAIAISMYGIIEPSKLELAIAVGLLQQVSMKVIPRVTHVWDK